MELLWNVCSFTVLTLLGGTDVQLAQHFRLMDQSADAHTGPDFNRLRFILFFQSLTLLALFSIARKGAVGGGRSLWARESGLKGGEWNTMERERKRKEK